MGTTGFFTDGSPDGNDYAPGSFCQWLIDPGYRYASSCTYCCWHIEIACNRTKTANRKSQNYHSQRMMGHIHFLSQADVARVFMLAGL